MPTGDASAVRPAAWQVGRVGGPGTSLRLTGRGAKLGPAIAGAFLLGGAALYGVRQSEGADSADPLPPTISVPFPETSGPPPAPITALAQPVQDKLPQPGGVTVAAVRGAGRPEIPARSEQPPRVNLIARSLPAPLPESRPAPPTGSLSASGVFEDAQAMGQALQAVAEGGERAEATQAADDASPQGSLAGEAPGSPVGDAAPAHIAADGEGGSWEQAGAVPEPAPLVYEELPLPEMLADDPRPEVSAGQAEGKPVAEPAVLSIQPPAPAASAAAQPPGIGAPVSAVDAAPLATERATSVPGEALTAASYVQHYPTVVVNGAQLGAVTLRRSSGGEERIHLGSLLSLFKARMPAAEFERLSTSPATDQFVSFAELEGSGLEGHYDPRREMLVIRPLLPCKE